MALLARMLEYRADKIAQRRPMPAALSLVGNSPGTKPAAVPFGMCVYAIGDIHGELDLLADLMQQVVADAAQYPDDEKTLIFLGDYIDRGPDSSGVIDYLLNKISDDFKTVFLRGNHEDYMLKLISGDLKAGELWMRYGGPATLASYGVNPFRAIADINIDKLYRELIEKIPATHCQFFKSTRLSHAIGDYYFVHAGVRPLIALDDQNDADKLWIRDEFIDSRSDFGKMIVHGHTIAALPDIQSNRIGIDTGAYATGRLTALRLHKASRHFLTT